MDGSFDYGFWPLVVIQALLFVIFAFSFTKPKPKTKTGRDCRSLWGVLGNHHGALHREVRLAFLLQWPTMLTLAMFPVLVWMNVRLATREEAEV